jgi:DNA-binding transcriptional LysR family regulator
MNIREADLNLLCILDALLRLRSVSRAAEDLGMSQPAVSFSLNKLRILFKDPLFIRAARGMRPTPRAEELAGPLQEVLDKIKSGLLTPTRFDPATTQRRFTFNMADVGELVFLPALRARLEAAAPGANIKTVSTPPSELEEAMRSGEVDLVVGYFPDLQGAAVYQQRLFSHSFVCIVRKDHPRIGSQLTRNRFLEEGHAVVQQEGKSHELFEQALADQGLARRVVISIPHFLAIPLIIAESDLIVTVPYAVARSFARMADLKMLPPPIQVQRADLKQYWHARFHHDPANQWIRGVTASLFVEKRATRARSRAAAAPPGRN